MPGSHADWFLVRVIYSSVRSPTKLRDLLALNFWVFSTSRLNWAVAGLCSISLAGIAFLPVVSSGKNSFVANVFLILYFSSWYFTQIGVVCMFLLLLCTPLQVLRRGTLGPKTFTIGEENFTEDDGRVQTEIPWKKIRSISKTHKHIFVRLGRLRYFILSARDFPDSAAFAQYYATLEKLRRNATDTLNIAEPSVEVRPLTKGEAAVHFLIRVLQPSDAEAYRALRLQALHEQPPAFGALPHDEPTASAAAARLEANDDRRVFGAFSGDHLVGIVRVSRYASSNEKHRAYLAGLYVLPAQRKAGIGRALANAAIKWASTAPGVRRLNLTVVTSQTAAISLYESLGFHRYGIERETFSDGGKYYDEALMTLALTS